MRWRHARGTSWDPSASRQATGMGPGVRRVDHDVYNVQTEKR